MTTENWITIIGLVVQTIIGIITVAASSYFQHRQIQVMQAQTAPTMPPERKGAVRGKRHLVWGTWFFLTLSLLYCIWLFIWLPYSPRLNMFLLLFYATCFYYNAYFLRSWKQRHT